MACLGFPALGQIGRLGNQLWQIASTIGLARRYGYEPRFPVDWAYRQWFSLPEEMFGIPSECIDVRQVQWPELAHIDPRTQVYLQDLALFREVETEIRRCFRPSYPAKARYASAVILSSRPVLVIHVRRGDNVYDPGVPNKGDYYPLPSLSYYLNAVQEHQSHAVAIYGDDYEWNRDVLFPRVSEITPFGVHLVRGVPRPKEHEPEYAAAPVLDWIDLFAMIHGQAYCLSNSTMGWWAAWLSGARDVTIPDPWYGPLLKWVDSGLMMPSEWKKVPAC